MLVAAVWPELVTVKSLAREFPTVTEPKAEIPENASDAGLIPVPVKPGLWLAV